MKVEELFSLLGSNIRYLSDDYKSGQLGRAAATARTIEALAHETAEQLESGPSNGHAPHQRIGRRFIPNPSGKANLDFWTALVETAEDIGRPFAPAEMRDALAEKGIEIPAAGTYGVLMNYLRKLVQNGLLLRPRWGVYSLPHWEHKEDTPFKEEAEAELAGA